MKKPPLIVFGALVVVGLALWFLRSATQRHFNEQQEAEIMAALNRAAQAVNASANQMSDDFARLDHAVVGPGRQLIYQYTLLTAAAAEIDSDIWAAEVEPTIRQAVMEADDMRDLFELGTTVIYRYQNTDGQLVGEVVVSADEALGRAE